MTKSCRMCSVTKSVAEFSRKRASKDGLQSYCHECSRQSRMASYRTNRDRERDKFRAHYRANKEQYYARNAKRRAAHLKARAESYSRTEIFARWGNECAYCSAPAVHLDHVVAISRGGPDAEHNLLPACASCNLSKGARSLAEWALSWGAVAGGIPCHQGSAQQRRGETNTMIYKTLDGSRVRTTHRGNGTEFETTNADREVISNVWLPADQAAKMIDRLQIVDLLSFTFNYGAGARTIGETR